MGCATSTIKYLLFIFNTLCALLGIATIVVNSLALKNVADETRPLLIFFIVVGSVVFLISFLGCCGAIKENICLTWSYAITLLVLLILTCVLSFVYLQRVDERQVSQNQLNAAWEKQKNGTDAMSFWQTNFKCCGIDGPRDYSKDNMTLPESCYPSNATHTAYTEGCLNKMVDFYEQGLHLVKIFSWVLIGVEGSAFLFSTILGITFNNEQRRARY